MDERDKNIVLELKESVRGDTMKHIKKCLVYGSRVRGENDKDSDLDILMLVDKNTLEIEQELEDATYQVMWNYNFKPIISLKVFSEDRFNQAVTEGFSFYRNAKREGVVI